MYWILTITLIVIVQIYIIYVYIYIYHCDHLLPWQDGEIFQEDVSEFGYICSDPLEKRECSDGTMIQGRGTSIVDSSICEYCPVPQCIKECKDGTLIEGFPTVQACDYYPECKCLYTPSSHCYKDPRSPIIKCYWGHVCQCINDCIYEAPDGDGPACKYDDGCPCDYLCLEVEGERFVKGKLDDNGSCVGKCNGAQMMSIIAAILFICGVLLWM